MHLERYIGKLVFFRVHDKRLADPFGLAVDVFLARVIAVDETGLWVDWNRYPLMNKQTGEKKFFKGELFVPHANIAAAFASEEFQQDVAAQAEAARLAHAEPAGEG
jgi:hypothetical protein